MENTEALKEEIRGLKERLTGLGEASLRIIDDLCMPRRSTGELSSSNAGNSLIP